MPPKKMAKLETKELEILNKIKKSYAINIVELGRLSRKIRLIDNELKQYKITQDQVHNKIQEIEDEQEKFLDSLRKKYGENLSLDIETGELL